jgi:hypothetical protein
LQWRKRCAQNSVQHGQLQQQELPALVHLMESHRALSGLPSTVRFPRVWNFPLQVGVKACETLPLPLQSAHLRVSLENVRAKRLQIRREQRWFYYVKQSAVHSVLHEQSNVEHFVMSRAKLASLWVISQKLNAARKKHHLNCLMQFVMHSVYNFQFS